MKRMKKIGLHDSNCRSLRRSLPTPLQVPFRDTKLPSPTGSTVEPYPHHAAMRFASALLGDWPLAPPMAAMRKACTLPGSRLSIFCRVDEEMRNGFQSRAIVAASETWIM